MQHAVAGCPRGESRIFEDGSDELPVRPVGVEVFPEEASARACESLLDSAAVPVQGGGLAKAGLAQQHEARCLLDGLEGDNVRVGSRTVRRGGVEKESINESKCTIPRGPEATPGEGEFGHIESIERGMTG